MNALKILSIKLKNMRLKIFQGKTDLDIKEDIIKMAIRDYHKGTLSSEEYKLMMVELDKIYGK